MATYIRLTEYKSSDEKEQEFFDSKNRYEAKQEDFEKIPGSPIAYWVSDRVREVFEKGVQLRKIADAKKGMFTGNNDLFLRLWFEIEIKRYLIDFYPYNKGGEYRKWYGNQEYIINWKDNGKYVKNYKGSGNIDENIFFKKVITWSLITTDKTSFRMIMNQNFVMGDAGPILLSSELYLCSFLNTKISYYLTKIINPTINLSSGIVNKFPIIFPKSPEIKQKIDQLTGECIDISKEEWDSRETSWDFRINELIRMKNEKLKMKSCKIKDAYNAYCDYWREKFYKLHKNEEELNRLFIEIYELVDELTADMPLEDITILKNESKIVDGKLEFRADEIMKQFISYGVGVMFGRYSLDKEGLQIANLGDETLVSQMIDETKVSFPIDEDNIIPVLEGEYFGDDIVSRFVKFVEVTFGKEHLSENISFIEDALGKDLRKYFVKDFYEDHIKRYKKRPIYWMISSPKKGFMALVYMHRYKSDIFASIQNDYVREYIAKHEAKKDDEQRVSDDSSNSPAQRKKAQKEVERISKLLDEVIKFDREILTKFATQRVEIDLDDGVKVNYCRFKELLYPIKGLCK